MHILSVLIVVVSGEWNSRHLIFFFFVSIWIFPFSTVIIHSFITLKLFLSLKFAQEYTSSFSVLPKNKVTAQWGVPGPPSGVGPWPFAKGQYKGRKQLWEAPGQAAATSQKRCSEHPEGWVSHPYHWLYNPRQEVTLGLGIEPNTVSKIYVSVYGENQASSHPWLIGPWDSHSCPLASPRGSFFLHNIASLSPSLNSLSL